jgi:Cu+-exporting ATPase
MVGTGVGARNGILIKGGEPLEVAQRVKTVVFDKTGTITEGKPRVVKIIPMIAPSRLPLKDLVALAGSAESNSEHPIGGAISAFAKEFLKCESWATVSKFRVSVGRGISCEVSGLATLRNPIVDAGEMEDVQLIKRTHRMETHDVEIQTMIIDSDTSTESMLNLPSYQVAVGSEKWATSNGAEVNDSVVAALAQERAAGNISVLVVVNG